MHISAFHLLCEGRDLLRAATYGRIRLTRHACHVNHEDVVLSRRKSAPHARRRPWRGRAVQGDPVVHMIPAWADSVLMYWGTSVAYENSGLDEDLIAELEAWDTSYLTWLKLVSKRAGLHGADDGSCVVVEWGRGVQDVIAGLDGDAAVAA